MNYRLLKTIGRTLFGRNNIALAEAVVQQNKLIDTAISENNLNRELLIMEQEKEIAELKAEIKRLKIKLQFDC